jgi:mannose-6-phosphate isomerase-like protein (cupin superfamily)
MSHAFCVLLIANSGNNWNTLYAPPNEFCAHSTYSLVLSLLLAHYFLLSRPRPILLLKSSIIPPEDHHKQIQPLPFPSRQSHFGVMKYIIDPAKYEIARKKYNQLLAKRKILWLQYRPESDINVQISRIYLKNQSIYLAFMRIKPKGFQSPRTIPADSKIIFHLIKGTALFGYKKKQRKLKEGEYVSVAPKTQYTIINSDPNQTCYFVMQYVSIERKQAQQNRQNELEMATERLTLQDPEPQQLQLPRPLAIENGSVTPKRERKPSIHLATSQDVKHPLTRSVVAMRSVRSQDATNECKSPYARIHIGSQQ